MAIDTPGRTLAVRAFWSDHPLCALYEIAHGQWVDGRFQPAAAFSLRDLIAFAEALPAPIIERLKTPD